MLTDNPLYQTGMDFFDQGASEMNLGGAEKKEREKWPQLRFGGNQQQGDVSLRILPFHTAHSVGHWVKTRTGKSYFEDCPAYDSVSGTINGVCPLCNMQDAITKNLIAYVIDIKHHKWLKSIQITPDKWSPKAPDADPNQPIMHPIRFFGLSKTMLAQIQGIKERLGSSSDLKIGYVLDIIRRNNNNKIEYQVIPGEAFPIDQSLLDHITRLNLPNVKEWHQPNPLTEILRSLFFNQRISQDQLNSYLSRYMELGLITDDAKQQTLAAINTYLTKHGSVGADPNTPMLPPPGTLPSGYSNPVSMTSPNLPPNLSPNLASSPSIPGLPPIPPPPSMPPAMPGIPATTPTSNTPTMPTIPTSPSIPPPPSLPPTLPSMPTVPPPTIPNLPNVPVPPPPPNLPPSVTLSSAPVIPGNTGILD
jgi:hypothetical protein